MTTKLALTGLVALLAASATPTLAKRARPPETTICNQTKAKQYIATMSYAGRGHQHTSGWTFIAPGKCETFREDRYYVRGSAKVSGLDGEGARRGCVTDEKKFGITAASDRVSDDGHCKEQRGHLVDFRQPKSKDRQRTERVVIR